MNASWSFPRLSLAATALIFAAACGPTTSSEPALGLMRSGAQSAPAANYAVLSAAPNATGAVTCTDASITGDIGSSGAAVAVTQTNCALTGSVSAPVSAQALQAFSTQYDAFAARSCDQVLTGTLSGLILSPGVYCFDAAATLTGTLTLSGPANGIWLFKVGTSGTGALTGTNFNVVMANGGVDCNVYWWVAEAATLTTSDFKGTIYAGAAITVTGGAFDGRALSKAAVTLTGVAFTGCSGGSNPNGHGHDGNGSGCNQGVGNGSEGCDPGNSDHGDDSNSNDENGGKPGKPGRQCHGKK